MITPKQQAKYPPDLVASTQPIRVTSGTLHFYFHILYISNWDWYEIATYNINLPLVHLHHLLLSPIIRAPAIMPKSAPDFLEFTERPGFRRIKVHADDELNLLAIMTISL